MVSLQDRASGVLLHPTSLPNRFPIGDLGPRAFTFIDYLAQSGQRWWQMLPVGPVGAGNSPYQAYSAFAGNNLLISPERIVEMELLDRDDLCPPAETSADRVDFTAAGRFQEFVQRKAFENFQSSKGRKHQASFETFRRQAAWWLKDYVLFSALRKAQGGTTWTQWDPPLRSRRPSSLQNARERLRGETRYHEFVQWLFSLQWKALTGYAAERGIGLIGDIPIFVAANSADVWAHPDLFKLRPNGHPEVVAGVPPDYFSKSGQRWGNPHYRWDVLKRQGYRWWIDRLRMTFMYFDAVRIDHFIGFVRYYEVPGDAPTAEKGRFRPGPGADFFKTVFRRTGKNFQFIAEDLGTVTPEVKALRDQFGLPGMRVLQFAFGNDPEAKTYQPHTYVPHGVVYTGTHDNDTTVGWFNDVGSASSTRDKEEIEKERRFALEYLPSDGQEIHWDMIRAAMQSVCNTVIIPMQDLLGLGSEARMNRPGTPEGNWEWRLRASALTRELAERLRRMTQIYGR